MGFDYTDDYNGANPDGFARIQMTLRKGRRRSAAAAYLHPAKRRRNLRVETGAMVEKINFDGKSATGVTYRQGEKIITATANAEVLLSGGSINSPQILMLSGVGEPMHLKEKGIEVAVPLEGVGQNLCDHTSSAFVYRRKSGGPFLKNMRLDRIGLSLIRA